MTTGTRDQVLGIYSGRAGKATPRRTQIGVYREADDIRVPRVDGEGRWLHLVAQEIADAGFHDLRDMRTAAVLRAALADANESSDIVLPRAEGANLVRVLEKAPSQPRIDALLAPLRAALDANNQAGDALSAP